MESTNSNQEVKENQPYYQMELRFINKFLEAKGLTKLSSSLEFSIHSPGDDDENIGLIVRDIKDESKINWVKGIPIEPDLLKLEISLKDHRSKEVQNILEELLERIAWNMWPKSFYTQEEIKDWQPEFLELEDYTNMEQCWHFRSTTSSQYADCSTWKLIAGLCYCS